ncbi:MAG: hypothetical protein ACQGVK_24675 [Myxococcota bacterium]
MALLEPVTRRWNDFFYRGFSGGSLGALRIAFGAGLFLFHFSQFDHVFRSRVGGAQYYFLDPMWHFQLFGIEHMVPLASYLAFGLLLVATLTMTVGLWTRTSIVCVLLCILYLKGVRDSVAGDVHHRYLMPTQILLFLLLSKSGWTRSLDERFRRARGAAARRLEEWEASWPIKAAQLYVVSFYFWSALAKMRVSGTDWFIEGRYLQSILLKRSLIWGADETGAPVGNTLAWELAQHPMLCMALALTVLGMEFGFPLILWVRSALWRAVLLAGVCAFHVANLVLIYVGFAFVPIVFLVFFDLDDVWRRWQRWRGGEPPTLRTGPASARSAPGP